MATNIELYEALKLSIGEDAARMIADVVPPTRDLATQLDIEKLRRATQLDIEKLRSEMFEGFARLEAKIESSATSTTRWMLTLFLPLWLGMLAAFVTVGLRLT